MNHQYDQYHRRSVLPTGTWVVAFVALVAVAAWKFQWIPIVINEPGSATIATGDASNTVTEDDFDISLGSAESNTNVEDQSEPEFPDFDENVPAADYGNQQNPGNQPRPRRIETLTNNGTEPAFGQAGSGHEQHQRHNHDSEIGQPQFGSEQPGPATQAQTQSNGNPGYAQQPSQQFPQQQQPGGKSYGQPQPPATQPGGGYNQPVARDEYGRSPRNPVDVTPQDYQGRAHGGGMPARQPAADGGVRQVAGEVSAGNPFAEDTAAFEPAPPQDEALSQALSDIDALLKANDFLAAHREMSKLYWARPEWRPAFQERIDTTAQSIYFDTQPHYMKPYVVADGDRLDQIAKPYAVPWEYLAGINRVDPRKIRPGQKLKVIKGPFHAIVDLSDFEMVVHAHGYYVRRFRIGIGKDNSTPTGKFAVLQREPNPTYYGPDGVVIERDDPQNPLGEYWIDLGDSYGIHGTIDPESIGKAESRGCIRMLAGDVRQVYHLLTTDGSEVIIRR